MKKHLLSFAAGLLVAASLAFTAKTLHFDPADKGLARVEKKTGKYIFLECEPVQEYDVAFEIKVTLFAVPENVQAWVEPVLKKALKISEKEHKEFDAIVMKTGQRSDIAIKFK